MKEISNRSSLCFTIRDLSSCIKAYALGYDYRDVIQCFYGARYELEERKHFNNFLKTKYNFLYKENDDNKIKNSKKVIIIFIHLNLEEDLFIFLQCQEMLGDIF